jgi:hypothetical protein
MTRIHPHPQREREEKKRTLGPNKKKCTFTECKNSNFLHHAQKLKFRANCILGTLNFFWNTPLSECSDDEDSLLLLALSEL